jgi:Zn-dependent protease
MDGISLIVFQVIVLIYSVVIHELSHGLMANSLGDLTAKHLGRLTLNPLKHLDMFGSFILPVFLLLVRSPFIFGYAKPVPYNPANLSDKKYGPAKVAFAGPAANLAMAVLFGLALRFMPDVFSSSLMPQLLAFIVMINLILALFNLMPIPPLDGHWLLMTFLPSRFAGVRIFLYRYSLLLLFFVLFFVFPILFPIVGYLFKFITGVGFAGL